MNIQEYISSGVIESYVLGLSSAEERAEFEKMCAAHREVLAARNAFELSLEELALQNGVTPPAALRNEIMQAVTGNADEASAHKVVSMTEVRPSRNDGWWKLAAAACFILLAASLYYNFTQYNHNRQLQQSFTDAKSRLDSTSEQLASMQRDAEILQQNPNVKMAALHGTDHAPQSFVTVYWDTTSKDVYLLVNNLPKPPSDKQYQLWALLDGKPIDMGMIDMGQVEVSRKGLLLQMKNAHNAQAFAITLERKGGSPTPTLEEMYAMGKL